MSSSLPPDCYVMDAQTNAFIRECDSRPEAESYIADLHDFNSKYGLLPQDLRVVPVVSSPCGRDLRRR